MAEPTHEEICKERIARLEGHIAGLQAICAELIKESPKNHIWGTQIIPKLNQPTTIETLMVNDNLHSITPLDHKHFSSGFSSTLKTVYARAKGRVA